MKYNLKSLFLLIVLSFTTHYFSLAQIPAERPFKIIVSPNHADWMFKMGENATFDITVLKNNVPYNNVKIIYEIGPERFPFVKRDSLVLKNGKLVLDGGTMQQPGFLRCTVTINENGIAYKGLATAAFDAYMIKPFTEMPADFLSFWDQGKKELAKIPMDAKMVLLPERCTENTNVYHINVQGYGKNSRLYGILCVPKKEGKYPALLKVPGAGVRPYNGDIATAEQGVITLEIGIHGIPVNLDPQVYANLGAGALKDYQNINLDDKDRFYYKRVYLNCIRANDFLTALPQYDGTNLGVIGGSQGGALSIVTGALDKRVLYLSAMFPALCDVTATLKGRAGGWPHYFEYWTKEFNNKPEKIATLGYYDVVNFAKQLKVPGIYSWGFNDEVCPPTSVFAAYNVIVAPKENLLVPETGHWGYNEQNDKMSSWIIAKLKK